MATKDLSTYTEIDAAGKITVSSSAVSVAAIPMNQYGALYKDYGADYFDALDIDFECINTNTGYGEFGFTTFSAGVLTNGDWSANQAVTDLSAGLRESTTSGKCYLYLGRGPNPSASDVTALLDENVRRYCTLSRAAGSTDAYLYIYSDSGRTTLVDTLAITGVGTSTKWRYHYAFVWNYYAAVDTWSGEFANFDFNDATAATIAGHLVSTVYPASRAIRTGGGIYG